MLLMIFLYWLIKCALILVNILSHRFQQESLKINFLSETVALASITSISTSIWKEKKPSTC